MRTIPIYPVRLLSIVAWCAGPILDKELRVASRRFRYYALRVGYAGALMFLILVTWTSAMHTGSAVVLASRMPEVAKTVTTAITWLQFGVAQVLAIVLLSSAVSEELRKGTLSALMTSPISSFQIIVGKLLSRLLQVLMLLAMSLPALAILRLLGGVSWNYVLAGGCVTLTTALCAGALSLWLSTHCRYGSKVVSTAVLIALAFYIAPWGILLWLGSRQIVNLGVARTVNSVVNPFHALYAATVELWTPLGGPAGVSQPWLLNSLTMLGLSLVLLALAIRRVRKAAVADMGGKRESVAAAAGRVVGRLLRSKGIAVRIDRPIRHVTGSPIIWKETRRGLWYGWSVSDIVVCTIALACVIVPLAVFGLAAGSEPVAGVAMFLAWMLSVLVLVRLAVDCAGNVPREREARTWPILLTTLLDDKEIVYGKAKAALLRSAPLLITLVAIHLSGLIALVPTGGLSIMGSMAGLSFMSQIVSVLLVVGLGSCFGMYIKTRSAAVVVTIVIYLAMKYMVGALLIPMAMIVLMGAGRYGTAGGWGMLPLMVIPAAIEVAMAIVALRVAALHVRRDIF